MGTSPIREVTWWAEDEKGECGRPPLSTSRVGCCFFLGVGCGSSTQPWGRDNHLCWRVIWLKPPKSVTKVRRSPRSCAPPWLESYARWYAVRLPSRGLLYLPLRAAPRITRNNTLGHRIVVRGNGGHRGSAPCRRCFIEGGGERIGGCVTCRWSGFGRSWL
jgi:hypothetical protein